MDVIFYTEEFPVMLETAGRLGLKDLYVIGLPRNVSAEWNSLGKQKLVLHCLAWMESKNLSDRSGKTAYVSNPDKASIEHAACVALIDGETLNRKDSLHQRSSGLNAVLAKMASENKKVLLINLSLMSLNKNLILGRFAQNIMLAKKYGLPVLAVSGARNAFQLRSVQELKAFSDFAGISGSSATKAQHILTHAVSDAEARKK